MARHSARATYVFGEFELDERRYELRRRGGALHVEPRVFDLLTYLLRHRERLVAKDELFERVWTEEVVGEDALTYCVKEARKAVADDGTRQRVIRTHRLRGYQFVADVDEQEPARGSNTTNLAARL